MYFKESLPQIRRSDLSNMKECLVTEININDQHSVCSIVIADFNAKCSKWYTTDEDDTVDLELGSITTTAGYSQMINKPTHFINESSSCIVFRYQSCKKL